MVTSRHNVNSYSSNWIQIQMSLVCEQILLAWIISWYVSHCLSEYEMNVAGMPKKNTIQISISILFLCLRAVCLWKLLTKRMNATVQRITFHGLNTSRCTQIMLIFKKFKLESLRNVFPFINSASPGCIIIYTSKDCFLFFCPLCFHQCGANWEVIKLSNYELIMALILLNTYHKCLRTLCVYMILFICGLCVSTLCYFLAFNFPFLQRWCDL